MPNEVPEVKKSLPIWAIALVIFIAGVAIGFGAFWMAWNAKTSKIAQNIIPAPVVNTNQAPSDVVLPTSTVPASTDENVQPSKNPYSDYVLSPSTERESLVLNWTAPKRRDPASVFSATLEANRQAGLYDGNSVENMEKAMEQLKSDYNQPVSDAAASTWELGIVSEGRLKGYRLYEQREDICELGGCADFRFLLSSDGKRALIMQPLNLDLMRSYRTNDYSGKQRAYMEWEKVLTPAFEVSLKDTVDPPKTFDFKGKKLEVSGFIGWDNVYRDWLKTEGKMSGYSVLGKTDEGYTIYGSDGGCVFVQMPNKFFVRAASKLAVKNPEGYEEADRAIDIEWDTRALNGKTPAKTYMATSGGCETFCPTRVEPGEDVAPEALIKVGTVDNQPIYIPKNLSNSPTAKIAYDSWYLPDGQAKPGFEEFLKQIPVPVFFWQDAMGRWLRYADIVLSPPAECGKPVIYLYPKETTNVRVSLPAFINVTVSEPTYPKQGWQTMAHPDGTLEYAGKIYGSLYWEGTGVGYVAPREGFLVKDGEQQVFLAGTLAKYGLNAKESKEFMDFWLPKMTGAPYYRVAFLTDVWSKAAPLYVNPKPETSIRIFMDWQKLSAPVKITSPQIVTPARNGFTLVEWGGLLYK